MKCCSSRRIRRIAWVAVLALALGAARTGVAGDPRELKAREDFAVGRYQEALEVYAKLYAETVHPTYLRNIGRCYQNLGQPDKAISSFREYLRKHKAITPEERSEVEGFIAEMQEMKRQQASEASPSSAPQPPPPTTLARAPEPQSGDTAPAVLVSAPATPPDEASSPVYTRWWFWTLVGAAAAGVGIGVFAATGGFTKTQDAGCPTGTTCPR